MPAAGIAPLLEACQLERMEGKRRTNPFDILVTHQRSLGSIGMHATVAFNSFSRRHTLASPYTHYDGTDEQLLQLIADAMQRNQYETGYRDGVLLISVPSVGFYTGLIVLRAGDKLTGRFGSRQPGETPRQSIYADRGDQVKKQPAKSVQIILYSHEVLAEDNDAEHNTDYEVISINGYPTEVHAPIDPFTLMHNHFKSDGGTATLMSPDQFENALKLSFEYWRDKAALKPVNECTETAE